MGTMGDRFKQARLGAGLSQPELATEALLSESTIRNLENNRSPGCVYTLQCLVRVLQAHGQKVSVEYFVGSPLGCQEIDASASSDSAVLYPR